MLSKCSSLTNNLVKQKSLSPVAEALLWSQLSDEFVGGVEIWHLAEIIGLVSPHYCAPTVKPISEILREADEIAKGTSEPPSGHDENNICVFWDGVHLAINRNAVIPLLQAALAGAAEKRDSPGRAEKRDSTGAVEKQDSAGAVEKRDVNAVVKYCVDEVRKDYKYFDAFYNSATKRVQNNIIYAYQQGAVFVFNKCMAAQGLPLGFPPR
jgi:hypothetical protein